MAQKGIVKTGTSGQILIEVLIGIVILSSIAILMSQISVSGLKSTKSSGGQGVMVSLAQEGLEAVEAIATADWYNIYALTKNTQEYYPKIVGGAWTLSTDVGDKTVTLSELAYQRWITFSNVSRDDSDNIVTVGGTDDPSTQKITVTVTATGMPNVAYSRYMTRTRNTTILQSDWAGGSGQGTNTSTGFDANYNDKYDSDDGNLDLTSTPGQVTLKQ